MLNGWKVGAPVGGGRDHVAVPFAGGERGREGRGRGKRAGRNPVELQQFNLRSLRSRDRVRWGVGVLSGRQAVGLTTRCGWAAARWVELAQFDLLGVVRAGRCRDHVAVSFAGVRGAVKEGGVGNERSATRSNCCNSTYGLCDREAGVSWGVGVLSGRQAVGLTTGCGWAAAPWVELAQFDLLGVVRTGRWGVRGGGGSGGES